MVAGGASAHNGEKSSEPANGAVLAVAPAKISFFFKQAVGQDSLTVLLIDLTGARIPLRILRTAQFEAVAELPPLGNGVYAVRWKLISSDGHPVTNKVTFTVSLTGGAPTTNPGIAVSTRPSTGGIPLVVSKSAPNAAALRTIDVLPETAGPFGPLPEKALAAARVPAVSALGALETFDSDLLGMPN